MEKKFKFIDLFAGIGGMRIAFEANGGKCVFSSEIDKFSRNTYLNNFKELPSGDITKIKSKDIPNHDVLLAGFPCQPFSIAGLKLGIEDARGTLFYEIARILKDKSPKFALLENVKGLISNNKGKTLQTILKIITDIEYECNIPKYIIDGKNIKQIQKEAKKMVLSAKDFGLPQNRQRIYIVLWKKGVINRFKYPKPLNIPTKLGDILEKNPNQKLTISDKLWKGHKRRKKQSMEKGKGFSYRLFDENSKYTGTLTARYFKDAKEILIKQKNKNPRRLSTREAARLQGFPDSFTFHVADTHVYKQIGNSVPINVVERIARNIEREIRKNTT